MVMAKRHTRRNHAQQVSKSRPQPRPQPCVLRVGRPRVPFLLHLALGPLLLASGWAVADSTLPGAGQISHGSGSIQRSAGQVDVHQHSRQMITNWESFNVGRDATVRFHQPDANAMVLNRVLSQDASRIAGRIVANGQVLLANPAGILFTGTARIDVGSLVAAGQNISDRDFLDGNIRFSDLGSGGSIINHGQIRASRGGYVALVGATVSNTGEILAPGGTAALAAGDTVRLEITGNSLIGIRMDGASARAAIDNSGIIAADDGRVILHSAQSRGAMRAAIRQSGEIRANRLTLAGDGSIRLDGGDGDVELGGSMIARGEAEGLSGGQIVATGERLRLSGVIDASGDAGGGEVYIGGGWQGNDPGIREPSEIVVERGAVIRADALRDGDGGTVALWSRDRTHHAGSISARGAGSGSGGAVETSSRGVLGVSGSVDVTGPAGRGGLWLLDPEDMAVTSTAETDGAGDVISAESLSEALGGEGVTVVLQANNTIRVESGVTAGSGSTLVFDAGGGIYIDAATQAEIDAGRLTIEDVRRAAEWVLAQAGTATITLEQIRAQTATGGGAVSTASSSGGADRVLPSGGRITAGEGALTQTDGRLDIHQYSDRLIATWATFNVGADARVNFIQPGPRAVALNRIFSNDASQIRGRITANGQVILVNPSGVIFTETARIDVGALSVVGSYRADDLFMVGGDVDRHEVGAARALINRGEIRASNGGSVTLVGNRIENTGMIDAAEGSILLTTEAVLTLTGADGRVGSELLAASPNGQALLDRWQPLATLDDPEPPQIDSGPLIGNSGMLLADGGWITLFTAGRSGGGGEHSVAAINQHGVIRANRLSVERDGGAIRIDAGDGALDLGGETAARGVGAGVSGGSIVVTGQFVRVSGLVDASGEGGGGDVFLGGGWQGQDPTIREAHTLIVEPGAVIRADATGSGDGGTVALWSSDRTRFDGLITARGAGSSGRGGAVETSSKGRLGLSGLVNVSAESGLGGLWLLDPENLFIVADDHTPDAPVDLVGNTNPAAGVSTGDEYVKASSVSAALNTGATVTLQAANDITVAEDIAKTAGGAATLIFDAGRDIIINLGKSVSSIAGALHLEFGVAGRDDLGEAILNGAIASNGGDVTFLKDARLVNATPVSTQVTDGSGRRAGNIDFKRDVALASPSFTVTLSADGAVVEGFFVGQGGNITIDGSIGSAPGPLPQSLVLSNAGQTATGAGVITLGAESGSQTVGGAGTAAIRSLAWTSNAALRLYADTINILASSGTALSANSSLNTPALELLATATTINVRGGSVGGTNATIDYVQDSFDIVAAAAANQTLTINADRSIRINGRAIQRSATTTDRTLAIDLNPYVAVNDGGSLLRGGSITLNEATLRSSGGHIRLGGVRLGGVGTNLDASGFAVGVGIGGAGVRIVDSVIDTRGNGDGDLLVRGRAPLTNDSGVGVLVQGSDTVLLTGAGLLSMEGLVSNGAGSGNKDGLIIGEGGSGRVTLETSSGNIVLVGDASAVTEVAGGARYNGLMITDRALIRSGSGDLLLIGRGGGGQTPNENHGILLSGQNTSVVSGSGDIALVGRSGGRVSDTGENSYGIFAAGQSIYIGRDQNRSDASGNVLFDADSMQFINTSTERLQVSSTGQLLIRPENSDTNIVLGAAGSRPDTGGVKTLFLGSNWFNGGANSVFLSAPLVIASAVDGTSNVQRLTVVGNAGGDFKLIVGTDASSLVTTGDITFTGNLPELAERVQTALRTVAGLDGTTVTPQGEQLEVIFRSGATPVAVGELLIADAGRTGFDNITIGSKGLTGTVTVAAATTFRDDLTLLVGDRTAADAGVILNADLTVRRQPNNVRLGGALSGGGTGGTLSIDAISLAGSGGVVGRGVIRADQLLMRGVDAFVLSGNNTVNRLAAEIDGDLTFRNSDVLEIGTVSARHVSAVTLDQALGRVMFGPASTPTRAGIHLTTGGQLDLTVARGDLIQRQNIHVAADSGVLTGLVGLRVLEGRIEQLGGTLQSNAVLLQAGSGMSTLLNDNSVNVLSGLFAASTDAGLEFVNDRRLTIGRVVMSERTAAPAPTTSGAFSGENVERNGLTALGTASQVVLRVKGVNAGLMQQSMIGDGTNSAIRVNRLLAEVADGTVELGNFANQIGRLAANLSGAARSLLVRTADDLIVGTVSGVTDNENLLGVGTTARSGIVLAGGAVIVEVGSGTLTLARGITTTGTGTIDLRSAGSIAINPDTGQVATLSSGSGTVQLVAKVGSITTNTANDTHTEILTSGSVLLSAGDAIGTDANRIELANATTLAAKAGSGGLWLRKLGTNPTTDAITVGSVTALNTWLSFGAAISEPLSGLATAESGAIALTTQGGNINIREAVVADGSGNVDLRTAGDGDVGIFNAAGNGLLRTGTGTVLVIAGGAISTDSANGTGTEFDVGDGGSLLLEANSIGTAANRIEMAGAGERTVAARARVGDLWLRQLGDESDVRVGTVARTTANALDNAIGGPALNAASLAGLTTLMSDGNITLTTQGGSILVVSDVVTDGAGTIDLRTADAAGAGTIAINGGSLRAGAGTGVGTVQVLAAGNIATNTATGSSNEIATAGHVLLRAGGAIGAGANHIEIANASLLTAAAADGGIFLTQTAGAAVVDTVSGITGVDLDHTAPVAQSDLRTTGGNGAIVLRTTAGNITLNNGTAPGAPGDTAAISADGSGNVLVQAQGAGTDIITNADIVSGSGNISVLAARNVTFNANAGIRTTSSGAGSGSIDVEATSGMLAMSDTSVFSTGSGPTLGNMGLRAAGDITLRGLVGDQVRVQSTGGSIIDGGNTNADIVATTAQLVADGSIGEADGTNNGLLNTTIGTLAASAGKNLYLADTGALTIGSVAAIGVERVLIDGTTATQDGLDLIGASAGDNLKLTATTALTVDEAVMATGNDLLLSALGGDLAVNAAVTATAGNASLLASAGITQAAAGDVSAGGTLDVNAQGGEITMANGAVSRATGNLRYLATDDVTLGSLVAANVRVQSTGGSIIDGGDTDVDVVATTAQLLAGGSIGAPVGSGSGSLNTRIGTLATSAGNNLYLADTNALTIGSVAAIDVNRVSINSSTTTQAGAVLAGVTAGDEVVLGVASGDLTVDEAVTATGDDLRLQVLNGRLVVNATVTADGDLLFDVTGGDLAVNAAVTAGRHASLLASAGITQAAAGDVSAGGTLDVNAQDGAITMADGAVSTATGNLRYLATGNVTLGSLDAANVRVQAGGSIIDGGNTDVDVVATTAQLIAGGSIGAADGTGALNTTVGTLAARAGNNLYLADTGALTIGSVAAIGVERVLIDGTTATQAGAVLAGATAGNNLKLTAATNLTVDEAVMATGNDLLLSALGGDLAVNAAVTAGRHASLLASAGITQAAAVDVSAGGTLDVNAQGGAITMADDAVSTATGNLRYLATGNVTLGSLVAANVLVQSTGGSIIDGGNTHVGVVATTAQLIAGRSIGAADGTGALNTTIDTLAASAGNNLYLAETNALTIGSVAAIDVNRVSINSTTTTQAGAVLAGVTAGDEVVLGVASGNLTVASALTAGDDLRLQVLDGRLVVNAAVMADADLLLDVTGGDLVVNAAVSTMSGNASLLASGAVTQTATGTLSVDGGTLDVAAGGDITMDAVAVSTNVNGNIVYNAGGSARIGRLDAGTGKVSIIAVGDILDAQNDRVDAPSTGPGFALLSGDARTVNVTAAELRLETQGAVGAAGNPFDTAVATLAVNADGGAYVLNDGPLTLGEVGPVLATRVAFDSDNSTVGNGFSLDALFATGGVAKFETRNGTLTLAAALDAGNDVLLAAGGAGSNVVINAALNLTGTGALTVLAQGSIEQAAVGITLTGTAGDAPTRNSLFLRAVDGGISQADAGFASTPGNVWLLARETITIGSVGGATVRVESTGGSVQSAGSSATDVIASNGAELIATRGDIGTVSNPLRLDVDVVAMEAIAIHVSNAGDLDIGAIAPFDVAQVMLNSTRVDREAGNLAGISAVEALSLSADGSLTVNAAVSVDDDLRLSALSGGRLIINADVSVGGSNHLSLLGDAGVAQAAGVRVSSGGTLDVESASGSIIMGDGAQASAGGDIRYAARDDVQLGRLETSANVGIFANNGAILNGGGPGTNIRADQLQLVAGNGIGTNASAIVTEVSRLAARAGAEGINISNTGALLIGPTTGVRVNRVADDGLSALIIAPDLNDVVTTGGGRIQLATSAAMTLAASVNSGAGVTTLIAGAGGVQGNAGSVLAAQGRVLSGGAVSLGGGNRLGSFAADIRSGGLSLNNLGTLTIGLVEGTAGVLTRGGAITLSANGGDLRLQRSLSTGSSASGVVNLRATGSVLRTSGAGFVRANQLAAVAGGDVFLTTPTNPVSTPAGVLFGGGANDVLTVAGRAGRNFVFAGGGNLRIGSVAGTSGVTGGFVWVRSGGDLDLGNAITVSGARGLRTGHGAVLVAEGLFRNTTGLGPGAIRDNGAGWLVYDGGSLRDLNRFAGLTSDFVVFNQRYDQLPANVLTRGGRGLITAGALLGTGAVFGGEFGAAPTDLRTAAGAQTGPAVLPNPIWAFGSQAVPLTETRIFTPTEPFLGVQAGLAGLGSAPVVALGQEQGQAIQAGVSLRVEPGLRFRSGLGGLLGTDGQLRGATLADGAPLPDWMRVVQRGDGPALVGQVPVDFVGPLVLRLEVDGDDPDAVEVIDIEVVGGERMQLITRAAP